MADLVLHHYPTSPFSEKIRAILGYKQLAWKSVHQPPVLPKPDQIALTGGYRKAPVLQIGADIYCDTKLIVRVLERLHPDKPLIPPTLAASCTVYEQWTEQVLFPLIVPIVFQPQGVAHIFGSAPPGAAEYFQKDRQALFASGNARRPSMTATRNELPGFLAQMEAQLAAAPFLLGAAPTLADFSAYHLLWFIHSNPGVAGYLNPYPNLLAWIARIASFGHGRPDKMSGADAIQLARNSKPAPVNATPAAAGELKLGDKITISATDYGTDPITGVLVQSLADQVAIRRTDERAGEVVVHFPRVGFRIAAASA